MKRRPRWHQLTLRRLLILQLLVFFILWITGHVHVVKHGRGRFPWGIWASPRLNRIHRVDQVAIYRERLGTRQSRLVVCCYWRGRQHSAPTAVSFEDDGIIYWQGGRGGLHRVW